ncbi:alpha-galactosidase [Sphingomonas sp. DG1-23]|uniref:glycoside hydrolase family 36 protein n=1 Tax=Sphingomonas sp. DG1-23 TaxID=3068316 RepID=UPI00273F32F8|nr:glycoside hydrolase family 36 protein [Sphingomonas sp. DG1-23]MDP5277534.1 alpha-galactosidase [Sphingomonas sp. DG1-23]
MPPSPVTRRAMLRSLMASGAMVAAPAIGGKAWAAAPTGVRLSDGALTIAFDAAMRSQLSHGGRVVTSAAAAATLRTDRGPIDRFLFLDHAEAAADGPHGKGRQHRIRATAGGGIELQLSVTFFDRYPGLALYDARFRNTGTAPIAVTGWQLATHDLLAHRDGAWTFAGASHPDRRDWVQPVKPGFDQRNFMGMNSSDYGGGTPVAVVWRRDVGLAVGHVETVPRLVALPVTAQPGGTRIGISGDAQMQFAPGATLALPTVLLMAHEGDHFRPLDAYRRIMAERGLAAPAIPESSYGPIWCAWGYERNFTTEQVYGTLPKARALGFEWAVLDDGWQTSEGDWKVDRTKFPRGDADMKAFADRIKADGMRPRLWLAPLAVDPGTDLLRDRPDMLILDRSGAKQDVTWWNAYTLCPAYQPVIDYHRALVRRIIGDWGFEGLKLDGQHLNAVAPCHNPAHKHERPEESFEKLQDFWKAIYDEAVAINREAIVEICPCGDSFAFHNLPATNNTPASDPTSSWQVRSKGKTFKALMGPSAPYSGDHVELSDGRNDFASTYGIGAIPSTKFTWPADTTNPTDKLPPGGFVLTAEKEALWRKWIDLYRANMLARGKYLGGLYDIGFDKPEGHAIEKDGVVHYAFFADKWDGPIALRGLGEGRYTLANGFTNAALGTASRDQGVIRASFEHFLLVRATPVAGGAA